MEPTIVPTPAAGRIETDGRNELGLSRSHIAVLAGGTLLIGGLLFLALHKKPTSPTNGKPTATTPTPAATVGAPAPSGALASGPTFNNTTVNETINGVTAAAQQASATLAQAITPAPVGTTSVTPVVAPVTPVVAPVAPTYTPQGSPTTPPASVASPTYYVIKSGDTLSAIAAKFGTTWQTIYNANKSLIDSTAAQHGITSSQYNWIYPGENIIVKS